MNGMQISEIKNLCKLFEQMPGMSLYEHGADVYRALKDIMTGRIELHPIIADMLSDSVFRELYDRGIIEDYLTWHDIGKPFCFCQDENCRWHFPNHAEISADIWVKSHMIDSRLSYDNSIISYLMLHDLDLLIMKPSEADLYEITKFTPTQILCAFAAIYSNAPMFGGLESESFKIKKKKLLKSCLKIIQRMKG